MFDSPDRILVELKKMADEGKFTPFRELAEHFEAADLAWALGRIDDRSLVMAFRVLGKEMAAKVFVEMESDEQELLISALTDRELRAVVDDLYPDDAADLIEELPAIMVKRILKHADPEMRQQINELLRYPKDSAGSIMTPEYVALRRTMTVQEAFDRIRRIGLDKETVYTCYVVSASRRLEGVITVKDLLMAELEDKIEDLMERDVVYFKTLDDRETVAQAFDKYDFLAFPITDGEGRLVGIVTVDDAMDVLQEETTEDIEKMAAILPGDKPYLKTGIFETFKNRIPWLLILMISATVTGQIIAGFEAALAAQAALIAFIPMLMDTGGNSGSQASVTIIRSLSLQELRFGDLFRVIWKELRVSLLCGIILSGANFLKILLIDNLIFGAGISLMVAAVVCSTLCLTVIVAKLVGCALPMAAKKIGLDPAVMASPFITTIVDAISLLIYFAIARGLLGI